MDSYQNKLSRKEYEIENKTAISDVDFENAFANTSFNDVVLENEEQGFSEQVSCMNNESDEEKRTSISYEDLKKFAECEKNIIGSQGQLCSTIDGVNRVGSGIFFYDKNRSIGYRQFVLTCAHNFILRNKDRSVKKAESSRFDLRKALSIADGTIRADAKTNIFKFNLYSNYDEKKIDFFNDIAVGVCETNLNSHIKQKDVFIKDISKLKINLEVGTVITLAGYPSEYKGKLYYMTGNIEKIISKGDEKLITYKNIKTSGGQSGSPVYVLDSDRSWIPIAVHLGYSKDYRASVAVLITQSKFEWIENVVSEHCTADVNVKCS